MELSPLLFGLYKFAKFFLYPVTWLVFSLGWLTLILLLPYSSRRHNKLRLLGLTACFILVPLSTPLVAGSLLAWWETLAPPFDESVPRRFDAIVVLGGGVKAHGTLRWWCSASATAVVVASGMPLYAGPNSMSNCRPERVRAAA